MTCTMVFCKAGDTKSGKMESRTPGNLKVRFGGRLTHDPSGRSQPIPLQDAHMVRANLEEACLQEALLHRVHLHGAHLQAANLQQAYLLWADLVGANMAGAQLQRAQLQWANLHDTSLQKADLQESNLEGVVLGNTVFQQTNLLAAQGLDTCRHLSASPLDAGTISISGLLPDDFLQGCG